MKDLTSKRRNVVATTVGFGGIGLAAACGVTGTVGLFVDMSYFWLWYCVMPLPFVVGVGTAMIVDGE